MIFLFDTLAKYILLAIRKLVILFLIISLNSAYGQLVVKGVVEDSTTNTPIESLLVTILHYKSNKIIAYSYTDTYGKYSVTIPYSTGIFSLKASNLDYNEYNRDIFFSDSLNRELILAFKLTPRNNTLSEVVIEVKKPPIIVKKDTIVYDIAHWTQTGDQNIEDVLKKIPGFEVLENGELKINGKLIGKVLINGEEFLKGGAALTTRSIDPVMVKNIEVRTDEKDTKLKESLLSSDRLIVLDIKLKDEFNKTVFGKARATSGYQKQMNMGGYANLFSLKKKQKYHLLGEYDAFGSRTISLSQIHNIGREAFQNIFNLPADYNNLTENQEFNKEIYGFKDYTQSRLGIVGLTGKFNLSSNLELFVGTYNSYTKDGVGSQTTQRFFEIDTNYQFNEQKANTDYVSKNKVDLQYNTDKIKANYNFNAVLSDKALNSLNQYSVDNFEFKTNKSNNVQEYYQNILFEYRLNKKVALHTKAFFGLSNKNIFFDLVHNQPLYIKYLYDDSGVAVFNFDQSTIEERKEFASDSRLQVQNKLGSFQIGFQYFSEQRDITKQAYKNINGEKVRLNNSLFNGETPILTYTKMMPYASHRFTIGKVSINNKIGLAELEYPLRNYTYENASLVEYDGGVQINFNTEDNFGLSYSQKLSSYSILNIANGYDLIDFQTFAIPQQSIPKPRIESIIQMNIDKVINPLNTALEAFALYAQSKTYNTYGLNSAPFISLIYDQLPGEYLVSGLKIATVFNNFPVNFKIEPSYFVNRNDNFNQGQTYRTSTERRMIQLRALTKFDEKDFNFELKVKFSDFQFSNELSPPTNQQMLSIGLIYKQSFFEKRMYFQSTVQHINFWGINSAVNLNVSTRLQYSVNPFTVFFEGDNLLNNQYFIKQNILPSYFINSQQNLFGRYVKVGVEYAFR